MYRTILLFLLALGSAWPAPAMALSPMHPDLVAKLQAQGTYRQVVERLAGAPRQDLTPLERPKSAPGDVTTWNAIIILVDFSDAPADGRYDATTFDDLLLSENSLPRSMRDYYDEVSYGDFQFSGDVVGWYRMPQPYSYYCNADGLPNTDDDFGWGTYPQNAQGLYRDAVAAADPDVDFNDYLNGSAGVEGVFIVHSGPGAETTGDAGDIWSHAASFHIATDDGVSCRSYTYQPELQAGSLATLGVFAHEFGHTLRLPDLYDTDRSSAGIGSWCLMAAGSWNGGGSLPAHMSAWCKQELGWIDPVRIVSDTPGVVLPPTTLDREMIHLKSSAHANAEFMLLETRKTTGFDIALPGPGLLVWHIDEGRPNNRAEVCEPPAVNHPRVRLLQADGLCELEGDFPSDRSDAFSLSIATRRIGGSTRPSTRAYSGRASGIAIEEIIRRGDDMHMDIRVTESVPFRVPDEFETLEIALSTAGPDDEVRLRADHVALGSSAVQGRGRITGGWDASFTQQDPTAPTLIDGGGTNGPLFTFNGFDPPELELDNLILRGGSGGLDSDDAWRGGVVSIAGGSFTASRTRFEGSGPGTDNVAPSRGGALAFENSTAVLSDCVFTGNHSQDGGAIWAQSTSLILDGVTFQDNTARIGGAVHALDSRLDLRRGVVQDNTGSHGSGGLHLVDSWPQTRVGSTVFQRNHSGGGAVILTDDGSALIEHNVFYDHAGTAVRTRSTEIWLRHNIFALTRATAVIVSGGPIRELDYNAWHRNAGLSIQGAARGAHASFGDPRFVDPEHGDFHLGPASHAIDAGNPGLATDLDESPPDLGLYGGSDDDAARPSAPLIASFRPEGPGTRLEWAYPEGSVATEARIFGAVYTRPGKGAQSVLDQELAAVAAPATSWVHSNVDNGSYRIQLVDADGRGGSYSPLLNPPPGGIPAPPAFQLGPAFPNPFNPATSVELCLGTTTRVRVEVYNLAGRRVVTLADGWRSPGIHLLEWTGVDDAGVRVASGSYVLRVRTDNERADRRVRLVK